jgi:hypothetical protein
MPKPFMDISIFGDKELERSLSSLPDKVQRSVVRRELKESGKRIHRVIIQKLSGHPIAPRTGRLLMAFAGQEVTADPDRKRGQIRYGIKLPEREVLGIPAHVKGTKSHYYPVALEYGYTTKLRGKTFNVPPKSYLRSSVDENKDKELWRMRVNIGKGIEKQWRRLNAGPKKKRKAV